MKKRVYGDEKYWKANDGSDIFRPNGFGCYLEEIYKVFLSLIDNDGKVIDFIEGSIKQAKEPIFA